MAYLYLLCAMCSSALISISSSSFTRKNWRLSNVSTTYNVFVTFSASFTWGILYLTDFSFDPRVLLFSLAYGAFYTVAMLGLYNALRTGSVSLTAFIKQLSLISVAIWGFIFWNSSITTNIVIGMVLIVAALYLCFKPDKDSHTKAVTLKWAIFALMLLVGNTGCSVLQKTEQNMFDKQHGNMLMFFGCLCSFFVCLVMYWRGKRCKLSEINKASLVFPFLGGLGSALVNLFTLLLIKSTMSESVFFPGIAVGGLIATTVYSVIFCREKLRGHQWAGLAVGAVALVFLNL